MSSSSSSSAAASESNSRAGQDSLYAVDQAKLEALRAAKPWMGDPKFMKKVKIGPSAAMKMLQHSYSGVEKGVKQGTKPIEVMGLLLGRPSTDEPNTFVVTDAFPLPIEGFETRVIADDQVIFIFGTKHLFYWNKKHIFGHLCSLLLLFGREW